jgi:hypothetical protein
VVALPVRWQLRSLAVDLPMHVPAVGLLLLLAAVRHSGPCGSTNPPGGPGGSSNCVSGISDTGLGGLDLDLDISIPSLATPCNTLQDVLQLPALRHMRQHIHMHTKCSNACVSGEVQESMINPHDVQKHACKKPQTTGKHARKDLH